MVLGRELHQLLLDGLLIIDPTTDTADTTTITGLNGAAKWTGGVLAGNGRIYLIPWSSTSVLIIDPATDTADSIAVTSSVDAKWYGGVLVGIAVTSSVDAKWYGGVLAGNGKIYGIPFQSTSVLIIDPTTNTADTTTITGMSGDGNWADGVLAGNGMIYGIPFHWPSVLIIQRQLITKGL